nr:Peptidase C48, SUMO/Sentrin/Ubl1 [Ipomoea batatas]
MYQDGGRGDCSPDCGAPLKAVRPVRPALVPVRSVGIGSSSPSTSAAVLDDSHFAKWVIEFGGDALDEVLFSYSGRIARRVDLRSLAPGVEVTVAVINVWSCILNYRERSKAPSAPARVFASPLTTLFFPIVESKRFYLLCVNFETERLEIIDSSASTEATALKYGDTPDNVVCVRMRLFVFFFFHFFVDVNVHRTSNVARALRFVSTSSTAT